MSVRLERPPVIGLDGFKFQMGMLRQMSEIVLTCDECGGTIKRKNTAPQELAEDAYFKGVKYIISINNIKRHGK